MASEIDKDFELKKTGLTYLYYYHKNYKVASIKEKRKIRKYYDEELRYKNAFYRDKKQFDKFGHPSDWEERKIKRFTIEKEMKKYQYGRQFFVKPFEYISNKLNQINISKQVDIELITIVDYYKHIHENYKVEIVKEIRKMKRIMGTIDTVNQSVQIKLGKNYSWFNLGYLQVVFKLQINTIVRYISISYQPSEVIELVSINHLEQFLRVITGVENALKNEKGEIIAKSQYFPDDFEITDIRLIQIELNKRTNLMREIREYYYQNYLIKIFELRSREVIHK